MREASLYGAERCSLADLLKEGAAQAPISEPMAEPAIITFAGDLELARYPEVHGVLEAAKIAKGRSLVLDLSAADNVDSLIAGELVLFIRRSLRYGATVAVVPPRRPNDWLTHAGSIREAHFRGTREEAIALVSGAVR